MSRTALVTGFTIVLVVLASVPTAYGLRWSYCRHYGNQLWAIHSQPRIDHEKFSWSKKSKEDRDKLQRWSDAIARHYAPEHDSWNSLSVVERDGESCRIFSEHPEKLSYFLRPEVEEPIPGIHLHQISYFYGSPSLESMAISNDCRMLAYSTWHNTDFVRTSFFLIDETGKKSSDDRLVLKDLYSWSSEHHFGETHYGMNVTVSRLPDPVYDAITTADELVANGLKSLNELEAAIIKYIDSDEPTSTSRKLVPVVDVNACSCDKEYGPANRQLTSKEKAEILSDVTMELARRRTLVKEHGKVWFETLQKIRIEVE
ncbi:hypothetical protein [Lacunimicrobium album]